MDSKNRSKSIQFFENLSFFPRHDICEKLNFCSLFLVSSISEKWEEIVRARGTQTESVWEVTLSKNVLMIYLKFKYERQNFQIGFKEDPNAREDFYFEHDQRGNWITFYYKNGVQLEESSFRALSLLSHLFPPTRYQRITVPLGPRSPDFPFRFLLKLPRGSAKHVDLQADHEVECGDLVKFLENVGVRVDYKKYDKRLDIKMRIKNLVPCDEITLQSYNLRIPDARFLTHESIQKLDVVYAEIGENTFTSHDFNAFFRAWMTNENKKYLPYKITFDIQENQKIKMEEVMEGLNAHVGKPRIRDRWKIDYSVRHGGYLHPTAVDCDQGWDIIGSHRFLGTVLLEPNRLSFFTTCIPFNSESYISSVDFRIKQTREHTDFYITRLGKLEKKIVAQGVNARPRDLNQLARLPESILYNKKLEETYLELKEKVKQWNND